MMAMTTSNSMSVNPDRRDFDMNRILLSNVGAGLQPVATNLPRMNDRHG